MAGTALAQTSEWRTPTIISGEFGYTLRFQAPTQANQLPAVSWSVEYATGGVIECVNLPASPTFPLDMQDSYTVPPPAQGMAHDIVFHAWSEAACAGLKSAASNAGHRIDGSQFFVAAPELL